MIKPKTEKEWSEFRQMIEKRMLEKMEALLTKAIEDAREYWKNKPGTPESNR